MNDSPDDHPLHDNTARTAELRAGVMRLWLAVRQIEQRLADLEQKDAERQAEAEKWRLQ